MEFQVEEYFEAFVTQSADDFGGAAGEQFLADLDPAKCGVQLVSQLQCGVTSGVIQGDDDRSLADGHWNGLSGKSKSARIVAQAAPLRDPMIGKMLIKRA